MDASPDPEPITLNQSLARYVAQTTAWHQALIALLTIGVFLLEVVPLELQRRVVNDLVKHRDYRMILMLAATYAGAAFLQGGTKLAMNIYRGWVGERATRDLRRRVRRLFTAPTEAANGPAAQGIQAAMVVSEVEPIGGFVGNSISEPLLQIGILASVLAYMIHVDYRMGGAALVLFLPQFVFVPLMQRAMNRRTEKRVKVIRRLSISAVDKNDARAEETHDDERIDRVFRLNVFILSLKFIMNFLMNFSRQLQVTSALVIGGWLVYHDQLEVGGIVAFISGVEKISDPWDDLVNYFRDVNLNTVKYRLMRDAVNFQATSAPPTAAPRRAACSEDD